MASALTTQKAFLNNFENVVNHRVDIQEDIKCYQDTLSYASSKVDYSVGENIYMLPSNMNLKIRSRTVGYNNKILVSDGKFSLGKNDKVNAGFANALSTKISHKVTQPTKESNLAQKPTITHEKEKKCLNTFFNCSIYDMVHITMKSFVKKETAVSIVGSGKNRIR